MNPECTRLTSLGLFSPAVACQWTGPDAGDPYPNHANVLSTPLVADFKFSADGGTPHPSIVFNTYNCEDGASMTIENLGSSVRVMGADGSSEELPASPANQNSRYGEAHDAVVLDGKEALVMKGNATPLACTR